MGKKKSEILEDTRGMTNENLEKRTGWGKAILAGALAVVIAAGCAFLPGYNNKKSLTIRENSSGHTLILKRGEVVKNHEYLIFIGQKNNGDLVFKYADNYELPMGGNFKKGERVILKQDKDYKTIKQ